MSATNIPGFRIVLSTCADRTQAEHIARSLVDSQLAACVNLLPGVKSIYRWQGRVESSEEVLLIIKTGAAQVENVQRAIASLHSYEVPELLVLDVSGGSECYLEWLAGSLK